MRNLKKILALVLAMVMTLSVMSVAGAFSDSKDFNGDYTEAAAVLDGLKVFQGYPDGSFQPKANITRAEVAALIYRIATGDVKDANKNLYKDYNKFTDVPSNKWYAGYVNYCANAEYIRGNSATTFAPEENVTGYQALAMILRVVGYDKNKEFTGKDWEIQVARIANDLGITKTLTGVSLRQPASREVVAEILFQTLVNAKLVTYTPALGYQSSALLGQGTQTLGYKVFKLTRGLDTTIDNWGRPGHQWFSDGKAIATIKDDPKYTSNVAVTECDIAKAVGQDKDKTYALYDNDSDQTGNKTIHVLATAAKVGAQGQILEVYKDRIVLIDTLLAQVEEVYNATFDSNGHLATPSKIVLNVYQTNGLAAAAAVQVYDTNGDENYTYAAGDYVLVNAHLNTPAARTVKADWQHCVEYIEILQKAETLTGVQTTIWYQADQHTVNGTTYNDAVRFHLNKVITAGGNRTWFFDQFGNLIGNEEIATKYSYAVVKNMWWAPDITNGAGVAKATLVYMDGSENTVTVNTVNGWNAAKTPAAGLNGVSETVYSGYSTASKSDMQYDNIGGDDVLYVASNAYTNAVADTNGIIMDNLFRVETASDGSVDLVEVINEITNAKITSKYAVIQGSASKAGNPSINTNSDTQYLLYNTATKKFEVISGFNAIPNFITNRALTIDYVVSNGYAKYVYIIGQPDTTTSYNFVMPLSVNHSAELKDSGGVKYYQVIVTNVGGEQTSLKVKTADYASVVTTLITNVNQLYYVTFTGDYATAVTPVNGIAQNFPGMGADQRVHKFSDNAAADTITRTGNDLWCVVGGSNYHFNVTDATQIVGELPDGRQTAKDVYVLVDNKNDNVAIKVWVVANGSSPAVNGPRPVDSVTNLAVVGTPAVGTAVDTISYTADPVYDVRSASTATCTLKQVAIQWQKVDANGYWQDWNGDIFVAGTYRANVTFAVDTVTNGSHGEPVVVTAPLTATSATYTLS